MKPNVPGAQAQRLLLRTGMLIDPSCMHRVYFTHAKPWCQAVLYQKVQSTAAVAHHSPQHNSRPSAYTSCLTGHLCTQAPHACMHAVLQQTQTGLAHPAQHAAAAAVCLCGAPAGRQQSFWVQHWEGTRRTLRWQLGPSAPALCPPGWPAVKRSSQK